MKKIKLILSCLFLVLLVGCSHNENVTSTIALNEDFSGEHNIVVTVDLNDLSSNDDPYTIQTQIKDLINAQTQEFAFQFDAWVEEEKLWYSYNFSFDSLEDYQNKLSSIIGQEVEVTFSEEGRPIMSKVIFEGFIDNGNDFTTWARDLIDDAGVISSDLSGYANLESSTLEYDGVLYDINSYSPIEISYVESANAIDINTVLKNDRIERSVSLVFNTTDSLIDSINNQSLENDFKTLIEVDTIVIDSFEIVEKEGIYTLNTIFYKLLTEDLNADLTLIKEVTNQAFEIEENIYVNNLYDEDAETLIGSEVSINSVYNYEEFKVGTLNYTFSLDNKQYISMYNGVSTDEIKDDLNLVSDKEIDFKNIVADDNSIYSIAATFNIIEDNRSMNMIFTIAIWILGIAVASILGFIVYKNRAKILAATQKSAAEITSNIEESSNDSYTIENVETDETHHVKDLLNINSWTNTILQKSSLITLGVNIVLLVVMMLILFAYLSQSSSDLLGSLDFLASGLEDMIIKVLYSVLTFNTFKETISVLFYESTISFSAFIFLIGFVIYTLPNIVYIYRNKKSLSPTKLFNNLFIMSTALSLVLLIINIFINFDFGIFGFVRLMLFINIFNVLFITYTVGNINFNKKYNELISYALKKLRFTFVLGITTTIILVLYQVSTSLDTISYILISSLNLLVISVTTIFGAIPTIVANSNSESLSGVYLVIAILLMIINMLYIIFDYKHLKEKFSTLSLLKLVGIIAIVQNIVMVIFVIITAININFEFTYSFVVMPFGFVFICHLIYAFVLSNTIVDKYVFGIFNKVDSTFKKLLKIK